MRAQNTSLAQEIYVKNKCLYAKCLETLNRNITPNILQKKKNQYIFFFKNNFKNWTCRKKVVLCWKIFFSKFTVSTVSLFWVWKALIFFNILHCQKIEHYKFQLITCQATDLLIYSLVMGFFFFVTLSPKQIR